MESLREEVKQLYRLELVAALDEIGEIQRQRGRVAAHVMDALGARSGKQLQRRHPDARARRVQDYEVGLGPREAAQEVERGLPDGADVREPVRLRIRREVGGGPRVGFDGDDLAETTREGKSEQTDSREKIQRQRVAIRRGGFHCTACHRSRQFWQ